MSTSPTQSPTVALLGKLRRVYEAVQYVEKRGTNDHHHYNYAMALDVVRDIRAALLAENVIVLPGTIPGSIRHHTETGGKSFVTTIDLVYRFMDVDTGVTLEVPWTGAGADTGGDKGLYKAYTGGLKYVLISLFLLPMTDDPERDALTQTRDQAPAAAPQAQAASPSADKDAERPAAPPIPLDRARLIAEAAVAAGLARWQEGDSAEDVPILVMSPVLKAKLAELGVSKLGQLTSDTAEALDAFIRAEAASA
jgi:hypothetical protein